MRQIDKQDIGAGAIVIAVVTLILMIKYKVISLESIYFFTTQFFN